MINLSVPDMSCSHCKASVEKAVASVHAGATVNVDLENRTVSIDGVAQDAALIDALTAAGYPATVI